MKLTLALVLCLAAPAWLGAAPLPYPFAASEHQHGGGGVDSLEGRVAPPPGAARVPVPADSFGAWLRRLPLLSGTPQVLLYNGQPKARQDVHAAVIDLDVGTRDLQQCADAVMRLWGEFLWQGGHADRLRFHPDPGKPRALAYSGGADRKALQRYFVRVFAEAGSMSLQSELSPIGQEAVAPGDVLIQGGYPGHALLVLDAAERDGRRYLLLGQSYMPAQQFHLLKNLEDPALSPWFDAAALRGAGLRSPEWRPFFQRDVRRFPYRPGAG